MNVNVKKIKIIISAVFLFLNIALLMSFSFGFAKLPACERSVQFSLLDATFKREKASCAFDMVSVSSKNSDVNRSVFAATYSNNFSDESSRIITLCDDNGLFKIQASCDGISFPAETALASGNVYSSQIDLRRFETLCINLLFKREWTEERNYGSNGEVGFIYIPDYYADYVIEHSEDINNYRDIVYGEKAIDIQINGTVRKYRVANIFHVRGFNEKYCDEGFEIVYNDHGIGGKMDAFFEGYFIISDIGSFPRVDSNVNTSLLFMSDVKKFIIREFLQTVELYRKNADGHVKFYEAYFANDKGIFAYPNSIKIKESIFLENGKFPLLSLLCIIPLSLQAIMVIVCKQNGFYEMCLMPCLFGVAVANFFYLFFGFVFREALSMNVSIYSFFNPMALSLSACIMMFAILYWSIARRRYE